MNLLREGVSPRGRPPGRLGRRLPKSPQRSVPKLVRRLVPEQAQRLVRRRVQGLVRERARGRAPGLPPKPPRGLARGLAHL